jgi:hypothetical protein
MVPRSKEKINFFNISFPPLFYCQDLANRLLTELY